MCSNVLRGKRLVLSAGGVLGRHHRWESGSILKLLSGCDGAMARVRVPVMMVAKPKAKLTLIDGA